MRRGAFSEDGDDVERLARLAGDHATPLVDARSLDPVLDAVGDARVVLLGEASHGTSEFYSWRAEVSRRLIAEKGFDFVAVEGDWPACREVDRFVRGEGEHPSAREALRAFRRWPTWMWANREVEDFAEWLRGHNARLPPAQRVGFYGLDVYSLWESMDAILGWLRENDHEALPAAERALACFEPYGGDEQRYAKATASWVPRTCEREVVDLLARLTREGANGASSGSATSGASATSSALGPSAASDAFDAEQNALVIRNAEDYYRTMVRGGAESWNVRDRHMVQTLDRLMARFGPDAKGVAWEHNTHVGDARYTDMAEAGMVNVGSLVRESRPPEDVRIVGFSSHRGSVVAARAWGAPMRRIPVPPARAGSWEDVLHAARPGDLVLRLDALREDDAALGARGHRAIGVVYDPRHEAWGNYVPTVMPWRYDVLLHVDEGRALDPLHVPADWHEVPETWPFAE